jgi:diguanylate cyclase (GGDEF)-like protein
VEQKIKRRRGKDKTFSITLAEIRIKLAVINAVLILCALGMHGTQLDYSIAGAYQALNLFCWLVPPLRKMATRSLRFILLGIDLVVTSFMIVETGGVTSDLYPFLFIPVLLAVLRYKYSGIITWCTMMSLVLIGSIFYSGTLFWIMLIPLFLKVAYLFLVGIIGGYLIKQTYSVKEEVSKTLTRWNIDLQRLNSFSQEVTGSSDLDEIFNQIKKTIRQTNALQMIAIMIFDDDETLKIYDQMGWEDTWVEKYHLNPLSKRSLTLAPVIVFKQPILCPNIQKHPELIRTFEGIPIESLFAFPLVVSGDVAGALVTSSQTSQILSDQETQILTSITNQASMAIQNVLNLNQEKRKADTDGLTGLFNRRHFNEQLEWLTDRAEQQEIALSLVLMDIDNFKKYNDTYGHPAGDQLLKVMTAAIADVVRDQDVFARYGGEEFAVILKDTNSKLALHIAERIRQTVESIPVGVLKHQITISVGVGTFPDHAKDRVALLDFVDKSLYQAKNNGKNRVCCGFSKDN